MNLQLSSKFSVISKFVLTLTNLYLVGPLIFGNSLMVSLLSVVVFSGLLFNAAITAMYIQWRSDNNWSKEWPTEDEFNLK